MILSLYPSILFLNHLLILLIPTITNTWSLLASYGLGLVLGLSPGLVIALLSQQGSLIVSELALIVCLESIPWFKDEEPVMGMREQAGSAVRAQLILGLLVRGGLEVGVWKMVLGIVISTFLGIAVGLPLTVASQLQGRR
jgi:hypothetical protein